MIGRFCVVCDTDPYKFDGVSDLLPIPPGCTLVFSGGRDATDDGGESSWSALRLRPRGCSDSVEGLRIEGNPTDRGGGKLPEVTLVA
jgi:hypothetical protein